MKGLLRKELICVWKGCRPILFIILVFTAVAPWSGENVMFLLYPLLFAGVLPMTLLSYDERDRWESFACGLPVSRAQLVSSKYLVGFGMVLLALLPTLLAQTLAKGLGFQELLQLLEVCLPVGLLSPAILLPVIFRFGVSKGRLLYYVIIGLFCALCFVIASKGGLLGSLPGLSPLLSLLSLPIYGLSWLLSIRLYEKRDL